MSSDPFPPLGATPADAAIQPEPSSSLAPLNDDHDDAEDGDEVEPAPAPRSTKPPPPTFDISSEDAFPSLAPSPSPAPSWGKGKARAGTPSGWSSSLTAAQRLSASSPTPNGHGSSLGGYGSVASGAPSSAGSEVGGPTAGSGVGGPLNLSTVVTYNLTLPTSSIQVNSLPNFSRLQQDRVQQPTTVGEVCAWVSKRYEGVTVEAGSGKGRTTFLFKSKILPLKSTGKGGKTVKETGNSYERAKAEAERRLEGARKELLQRVSKKETLTLEVPGSTKPFIIGAKGRNLKAIIDSTGTSIQIPRADDTPAPPTDDSSEPGEDPLIPITITGDHTSISLARQQILAIVSERTSKTSVRVSAQSVPTQFWPLIAGPRGEGIKAIVSKAAGSDGAEEVEGVNVAIPSIGELARWARGVSAHAQQADDGEEEINGQETGKKEKELAIVVSGEKELVARVVEGIQATYSDLKRTSKEIKININKRQHRFLVGQNAVEILDKTGCAIEVPSAEDPSEQVIVRGKNAVGGLGFVMEKAESSAVDSVDLLTAHRHSSPPAALAYARSLSRYLLRKAKLRKLQDEHTVSIYVPRPDLLLASSSAPNAQIEIVGPDAGNVEKAREEVLKIVKGLRPSSFDKVEIDVLVHKFLIGKKGNKIRVFEEKKNVDVIFPGLAAGANADDGERNEVVLVYSGSGDEKEAKANLEEVKEGLLAAAKEAADLTTSELRVPQKFHRVIIGPNGTTLNAIIGEEKSVSVKFPSAAQAQTNGKADSAPVDPESEKVVVRGPSDEVARVVKEIERIAEEAKNDDIVNSYTVEFEIDTKHVSHVIGKQGAGLNALRDELGVRVDLDDVSATDPAAASSTAAKKRTTKPAAKTNVTVKGRKENVEDARKRIEAQCARMADETTASLAMPSNLDKGTLIGKQGAYVQRLEAKYFVRINFPKDRSNGAADDGSSERGGPSSDEIRFRGPKKGVEAAMKEIKDLIAFEKERGATVTFTVSAKAVPRILGRGGSKIQEIGDETGAAIDVDKVDDQTGQVSIRGTKEAIAQAKKLIEVISKETDEEDVQTIEVERSLHTNLIGKGGANLRELILRCGGPTEARAQGALIRFPRPNDTESGDTVTLRGPKALIAKIKAELEKEVANLRDRIVYGVSVPRSTHANLIGRGGSGINALQAKHSVKIIMPSWNESSTVGEPENAEDLKEVKKEDLVKLLGSKSNCEAAAAELKTRFKAQAQNQQTVTLSVPARYHTAVADGGRFFRSLPPGVRVTHGDAKIPSRNAQRQLPPRPTNSSSSRPPAASSARIDQDEDDTEEAPSTSFVWDLVKFDDDSDNSPDIPWIIAGNNSDNVTFAAKAVQDALDAAKEDTAVGYLTVPPSLMPRIVGRGGSGLEKLRAVGVKVETLGRKGSDTLSIAGSPEKIETARQMIEQLADQQPQGGRGRRREDDY